MWSVQGVLGHGGHGTVYLVEERGNDGLVRKMALKVLGPASTSAAQRLRDEARILALVRHRAVARAEALVRVEGRWAMLLEYVEGASLRDALLAGALPPAAAFEVAGEVARALDAVWHAPGVDGAPLHVLHRDLKPSNVQLSPAGEVKLLDFGIARAAAVWREAVTTEGVAGTPGYVPPERLEGGEEGPAGDVFALGVLLAEMLTGEPVRQFPVGEERFAAHLANVIARLPTGGDLIAAMLSHDPARRPSAREVERQVESLRKTAEGPSLRDWAEREVPRLRHGLDEDDPLVGRTLTIEAGTPAFDATTLPPPSTGERPGVKRGARLSVAWILAVGTVLLVAGWGLAQLQAWRTGEAGAPSSLPDASEGLPETPVVAVEGDGAAAAVAAVPTAAPGAEDVRAPSTGGVAEDSRSASVGSSSAVQGSPPSPSVPARAVVAPSTGSVRIAGDAEAVVLLDAAGSMQPAAGTLLPGTYTVRVRFVGLGEGPGGTVRVEAGRESVVECWTATLECRSR